MLLKLISMIEKMYFSKSNLKNKFIKKRKSNFAVYEYMYIRVDKSDLAQIFSAKPKWFSLNGKWTEKKANERVNILPTIITCSALNYNY